ncbi:MAG TPA: response regulator [Woeseiaceae bacterium]
MFEAGPQDAMQPRTGEIERQSEASASRDSVVPPAIALLDDDPAILRSMGRLLRGEGFDVLPFTSPSLFLSQVASLEPVCAVIDLSMPELSGLDVQRVLAERGLICPMVFVTGHGDIPTSVQAMRDGAVDFLTKPFNAEELLRALERACATGRDARALDARLAQLRQRVGSLTERERQVFEQVVAGLLNKQIAANLAISEKTVKVHRGRVMRKMAVRSVAQLVRAAEQIGIQGTPT